MLVRYREFPDEAGRALLIEHISLALNPRVALYARGSLRAMLEADGNAAALAHFQTRLAAGTWALYRARRGLCGWVMQWSSRRPQGRSFASSRGKYDR